jgi:hypothetical protein
MSRTRTPVAEERIGVASGRLRWTRRGDDLVAGRYRIRLRGPGEWELMHRGRALELHARRSNALARAERHHREAQRRQQITCYVVLAGVGFVAASVVAPRLTEPWGLFVFAVAIWVLLRSAARGLASATRNLLDPYRTKEKWEPRDWWNYHD